MTSLLSLCSQSKDKTILYAVACTLINCTNSYDKKEIIPEMVQLAKFSKQHVPEQHPKVKEDGKVTELFFSNYDMLLM